MNTTRAAAEAHSSGGVSPITSAAAGASASAPPSGEAINPDVELERHINYQTLLLCSSPVREQRVAACEELRRLVASRSPAQVKRMEKDRGLR